MTTVTAVTVETTRATTGAGPMEEGLPEEANAISQTTELTTSRQNLNNQQEASRTSGMGSRRHHIPLEQHWSQLQGQQQLKGAPMEEGISEEANAISQTGGGGGGALEWGSMCNVCGDC